jgi:HEAT repeat protein
MKVDDETRKQVDELLSAIEIDDAVVHEIRALDEKGREYLVSLLEEVPSHPRRDLVHNAIYVLGELGRKDDITALLKLIDSSDENIQIRAVHALGRLDVALAEEQAFRILENKDVLSNVKGHALMVLSKVISPESTERFQQWVELNHDVQELKNISAQIMVDIGPK